LTVHASEADPSIITRNAAATAVFGIGREIDAAVVAAIREEGPGTCASAVSTLHVSGTGDATSAAVLIIVEKIDAAIAAEVGGRGPEAPAITKVTPRVAKANDTALSTIFVVVEKVDTSPVAEVWGRGPEAPAVAKVTPRTSGAGNPAPSAIVIVIEEVGTDAPADLISVTTIRRFAALGLVKPAAVRLRDDAPACAARSQTDECSCEKTEEPTPTAARSQLREVIEEPVVDDASLCRLPSERDSRMLPPQFSILGTLAASILHSR
jgi:hypothetical protein